MQATGKADQPNINRAPSAHNGERTMELTRRQFIGKTATAVIVAGTMAAGKVFGANNRIRMCTVGFNGQGGSHIKDILEMKDDAEYVALCDVESSVLERGAKAVETAQGKA